MLKTTLQIGQVCRSVKVSQSFNICLKLSSFISISSSGYKCSEYNTMHASKERDLEVQCKYNAHHYLYLYDSLRWDLKDTQKTRSSWSEIRETVWWGRGYDSRLFAKPVSVAILKEYKHFCPLTWSEDINVCEDSQPGHGHPRRVESRAAGLDCSTWNPITSHPSVFFSSK